MTGADYADNLVLLANTLAQTESPVDCARHWPLCEYKYNSLHAFKQERVISTLRDKSLKLENHFIYLDSNISYTKSDANIRIAKTWNGIDTLSII